MASTVFQTSNQECSASVAISSKGSIKKGKKNGCFFSKKMGEKRVKFKIFKKKREPSAFLKPHSVTLQGSF